MSLIQTIGVTPWRSYGDSSAWPSGTQPGDLAIYSLLSAGSVSLNALRSWSYLGRFNSRSSLLLTGTTRVYSKVLTAADIADGVPSIGGSYNSHTRQWQVLVTRSGEGIGTVRTGSRAVAVEPNGLGVIVAASSSSSGGDLPSGTGIDWILPPGVVWQWALLGPAYYAYSAMGTVEAASDGSTVGSPDNDRNALAIEILPPRGPREPSLLYPAEGNEIAYNDDITFEWRHRPTVSGGAQRAYRLRFEAGEDYLYWNASTGQLVSSQVTNVSGEERVTLPAGLFPVDAEQTWEVQTQEDADGQWSPWSAAGSFMPVIPPTAVITEPSGTLHDDLAPVVRWTSETPRGEQTAYRVRVAFLGSIIYDSRAIVGAATEFQLPVLDWSNGAGYQVQVQVQQTGGAWSLWDTREFFVSWTEPEEPVVQARRHEDGIEVTVLDGEVAQARATLEAVLGEEPVYSPDAPADLSRAWYNAGEVRRWVDYGPGPVTNLVTNPRGRRTSGTVTIRENFAHIADHAGGSGATVTLQPDGSLLSVGLSEGSNYVRIRSWESSGIPLVEGEEYTASIYARADDDLVSDADIMIQWYGPDGYISPSPRGARVPVTSDGWTRIVSHGIVPEGATHYNLWVERKSARPGDRWMVRDVMFERGSEALPYFDGDTWDGDPDFTPEWTGTPGESTSRLVAPAPVGWETLFGSIYYSESRDALALLPNPDSGNVYPFGDTDVSPPTPFTRVFTLWTDTGNSVEAADNSQNMVTVHDGETSHTVFETSATGFLSLFAVDEESPVNTIYIRAAIVPGEYSGPYFDGHTLGVYWDGDPDNSTSTYPGPQWALVKDADVVDAAQALHAAETTARTYTVERINLDGTWSRVLPWRAAERGALRFVDVFAPYDQPTAYRAQAAVILDGVPLNSDWALSSPVTSYNREGYIGAATSPVDTWVRITLVTDGRRTQLEGRNTVFGLGDDAGRVLYGSLQGQRGSFVLYVGSDEEYLALKSLLNARETMRVKMPPDRNLHRCGFNTGEQLFIAREELDYGRLEGLAVQSREVEFEFITQNPVVPELPSRAPITHPVEGEVVL